MSRRTTEIPALTGLRGVAAMAVVFDHLHWTATDPNGWGLQQLINHGFLAVDVFFCLSGFLMVLSYRGLFEGRLTGRATAIFLWRRLARVYPVYLVATLAFLGLHILGWAATDPITPLLIGSNLTMTQHWFQRVNYDPPAWSVSVEWAVYLVFPLLLLGLRRLGGRGCAVVAALCLASIALRYHTPEEVDEWRWGLLSFSKGGPPYALLRCLSDFVLGMLVLRAYEHPAVRTVLRHWASPIAAIFLAAMAGPVPDEVVTALIPLLLLAACVEGSGVARALGARVCLFLGEVSYAVYLFHWLAVLAKPAGLRWLGLGYYPLAYAAILLGGWIVFRGIERPARRGLRAREPGRRAEGPASALPATS